MLPFPVHESHLTLDSFFFFLKADKIQERIRGTFLFNVHSTILNREVRRDRINSKQSEMQTTDLPSVKEFSLHINSSFIDLHRK